MKSFKSSDDVLVEPLEDKEIKKMFFSMKANKRKVMAILSLPLAFLLSHCAESFDPPVTEKHTEKAYVASADGSVAVITHGDIPKHVKTISAGGSNDVQATFGHVYINSSETNSVAIIDANKEVLKGTITVGERPVHSLVVKGGNLLLVGNDGPSGGVTTNDPALVALDDSVSVIDTNPNSTTFMTELARIRVGNGHHLLAYSDETSRAAVTNLSAGTTSIIDVNGLKVICTVAVGAVPHGIAYSDVSGQAYVANIGSLSDEALSIFNLNANFTVSGKGSTSSTATIIDDPAQDFVARGVVVGNVVRNKSTGVFLTITGVTSTQLTADNNGVSWNDLGYSVDKSPKDPYDVNDPACRGLRVTGITKGTAANQVSAVGFTRASHGGKFIITVGYVLGDQTGHISVIQASDNSVVSQLSLPNFKPDKFAITEDNDRIYVSSVLDEDSPSTVPGNRVAVIDMNATTGVVTAKATSFLPVGVGHDHRAIALSSDDLRLFVPNSGEDPGTVSVFDTVTLSLLNTLQVSDEPNALFYVDEELLKLPASGAGGGGHGHG